LGEARGPTVFDAARGNVDGVYAGGVDLQQPGALVNDEDTAVYLDAENTYLTFGDPYEFAGKAPFTLEAWIDPETIDESVQTIWSRNLAGIGYAGAISGPGGFFCSRADTTMEDKAVVNASVFRTEGWWHVACVFDGLVISIYVNGISLVSQPSYVAAPSVMTNFVVGAAESGNGYRFKGLIDEVAIYETALEAPRVKAHYEAGVGP
jgi:hypothetical protein